jgi:acetyl/propionyl-CoA carboxylase alpha subunit
VYEQINIAAGRPLELSQPQITPRGWAIECRVYAEDPYNGFLPSQGRILRLRLPSGAGVRNDVGIFEGYDVPLHYDPLLAKLIVYGRDRNEARLRMLRAFDEYRIDGIQTTIPFHRWLLAQEDFARGELDTGTIERRFAGLKPDGGGEDELVAVIGAVLYAHEHRSSITPASVSARAPSAWKRSERTRRWPR